MKDYDLKHFQEKDIYSWEEIISIIEDMENDIKIQGGSLVTSLLLITFIVLKLTNVISWSWWWVLSPIWIPMAWVVVLLLMWFIANMFDL